MARKRRAAPCDDGDDGDDDDDDELYKPRKSSRKTRVTKGKVADENSEPPATCSHSKSLHTINSAASLREALLVWYSQVHARRGMPWRKPYNPSLDADGRAQRAYEVWVSEVMLQQTQVSTVIPYYDRWMRKFPTIRDLASADIEEVNSLWKGLGYYSRAARLLKGARKVVEEFGGRLPTTAKELQLHVPGIGRYSSGAIASISYNECVPVLDGNVHRLLSRILALHAPPKAKATLDILWQGATEIVRSSDRPGEINQAMIELGSTVCKVRNPDCGECPLQPHCRAYQMHHEESHHPFAEPDIEDVCMLCEPVLIPHVTAYPMRAVRKKVREETDAVLVVEWRKSDCRWFLLVRRPEGGLLAGLYEFPTVPNVSSTMLTAELAEKTHALLCGLLAQPIPPYGSVPRNDAARVDSGSPTVFVTGSDECGDVLHVFSHVRKHYRIRWVVLEGGGAEPPHVAAVPLAAGMSSTKKFGDPPQDMEFPQAGRTRVEKRPTPAMWVRLDKVSEANVGTGMLKVWGQARARWTG